MDHTTTDPTKLFSVKGIVAVITGGGTGLGLMLTKTLASNSASKIYIIGRRPEKLHAAVTATSINGNVIPIVGDVTSKASLTAIASQIKSETGYINLLISNSGYYPTPRLNPKGLASSGASLEEFADAAMAQDPEAWERGFATNTTAVAFTTFAFLKLLGEGNKPQNQFSPGVKSQVLVTTSIAGYIRNTECYALTKAATTHLIKSLALNLAPYEIRMNGLAPGLFPTDLAEGLFDKSEDPSVEGAFPKSFVPAERLGATSDMAGFVLYAAGQAGAYLNGNIMVLDGGRMSLMPTSY
ncbi:hypothetical protein M409DRAFT_49326 [Zasmidium cellare ATCC 36951]|uniref:Uncharacterized protein n=1 Tax=Zasmidium cellare ATCC 36951 TaxID=1080233 RepID=A0A6A6D2Y2_ZASCE|nr:uncharacterized protein M409DRAFT_49326 [Zasmidium cellare ATCC 36951]KAF2172798.1 hypothetical protein M409DRAFT_49326 [Zasmidium cellare ATCC 36951]